MLVIIMDHHKGYSWLQQPTCYGRKEESSGMSVCIFLHKQKKSFLMWVSYLPTSTQLGLPSQPGLLVNDEGWLSQLFHQLPQHPGLDPIQSVGLVHVQVLQLVSNQVLMIYGGFILFPVPIFQLRGWVTTEQLLLLLWTEAKTALSNSAFSLSLLLCFSPCHIQKKMGILLSPPFVVTIFIETFLLSCKSSQIKL